MPQVFGGGDKIFGLSTGMKLFGGLNPHPFLRWELCKSCGWAGAGAGEIRRQDTKKALGENRGLHWLFPAV
jgi:hypothetical protein